MSPDERDEWQEDEVNLLDYWRVLKKRGWMILGLVLVSVFTAGFMSYFVMTKIYESRASILAPKESGGSGASLAAALAASGAAQFLGGLIPGGGSSRDVFVAILKSRTMAQDLVERFNLKEYYKAKYTEDTIKGLQGATDISVSKEGAISVKVEDKDPKLAADIANAYVTNLDRLFAKLGTTDASRQRAFITDRLEKTEKALRQAEDTLRIRDVAEKSDFSGMAGSPEPRGRGDTGTTRGHGDQATRGHGDKGQRGGGARNVSGTKSSWVTAKPALSGAEGNASPRPIPPQRGEEGNEIGHPGEAR
jgi:uncharacterized protein involved in exopolysaccharide biosynthesis